MKIKSVSVVSLFGLYDYTLDFVSEEPVTIIFGTNGVGKTTVLRLIKAIINADFSVLKEISFQDASILFDTNEQLTVTRIKEKLSTYVKKQLNKKSEILSYSRLRSQEEYYHLMKERDNAFDIFEYTITRKRGNSTVYPVIIGNDIDIRSMRERNYIRHARDYDESEELHEYYSDRMNDENGFVVKLKNALSGLQRKIHIQYIQASRLLVYRERQRTSREIKYKETIEKKADELQEAINMAKKAKDLISERIDATYPQRLLRLYSGSKNKTWKREKDIQNKLIELERKRRELIKLGLLQEDDKNQFPNVGQLISYYTEEAYPALALYIGDYERKLSAYDGIKEKIALLIDIINNRNSFLNKKACINADGMIYFQSVNGDEIGLTKLSSGEKNLFILFYDLIFGCDENTTILIDEPEISLHIGWQREFMDELVEICKVNGTQAVVATHSSSIIGDYYESMVELENKR